MNTSFTVAQAVSDAMKENNSPKTRAAIKFLFKMVNEEHIVSAITSEIVKISPKGAALQTVGTRVVNCIGVQYLYEWALAQCKANTLAKKDTASLVQQHLIRSFYSKHVDQGKNVSIESKNQFVSDILYEASNMGKSSQIKKLMSPRAISTVVADIEKREVRLSAIIQSALLLTFKAKADTFVYDEVKGRVYSINTTEERESEFFAAPVEMHDIENDMYHTKKMAGTLIEANIKRIISMPFTLDTDYNNAIKALIDEDATKEEGIVSTFDTMLMNDNAKASSWMANKAAIKMGFSNALSDWDSVDNGTFYINVKVDFRGRVYPRGAMSSISHSALKAGLRAGVKTELGTDGYSWLKRAIAGFYGNDNMTWEERDAWFATEENNLVAIGHSLINTPVQGWNSLIELGVDDIYGIASALIELARIDSYEGTVESYESNLMANFDGTSSATQLISLNLHAKDTAISSNVCVPAGLEARKYDSYRVVAEEMAKNISLVANRNDKYKGCDLVWNEVMADDKGLQRKAAKVTYMKRLYGAVDSTMLHACRDLIVEKGITWTDDSISTNQFGNFLGAVFNYTWKAADSKLAPLRAWEVFASNIGKAFGEAEKHCSWTYNTPGFEGMVYEARYTKQEGRQFRMFVDGVLRKGRSYSMNMLKTLDPYMLDSTKKEKNYRKATSALAPHLIHTLDSLVLAGTVVKMPGASMILTHDSMGCTLGRVTEMMTAINDSIIDLYQDGGAAQLQSVIDHCKSVTKIEVSLPESCVKNPSITVAEMKNATYAYC